MKGRILTSLLTVIALTGLQAQNIPAVPRLVVGLTIDQLRTDYIEAFSALYGERGFKRLWREGRIYRNAEYDFINVDKSSAVAAIYSGTTPYTNGIVGDNWMDRSTLRVLNCVDDADFMGIYTSESTSPQKMKVSTLTDELVIATQGIAEVYSIAPTREMAVLAAGHASKGAFWLNDETGKWSGNNPYFFKGKAGEGVGGPHVGLNYIWPMSIIMKAFTTDDSEEIRACLKQLRDTDGGTGFMHESFHSEDAADFTRSWFAWTNTLFGELILNTIKEYPNLLSQIL